jgi:hypothetical protein
MLALLAFSLVPLSFGIVLLGEAIGRWANSTPLRPPRPWAASAELQTLTTDGMNDYARDALPAPDRPAAPTPAPVPAPSR